MAKRIPLFCTAVVVAVVFLRGIVSLVGNPVSGGTWSLPHSGVSLYSHQYPVSFRVDRTKSAVGITFGRCCYIRDPR